MANIGVAQPYAAVYSVNNGSPSYTGLAKVGKAVQVDINVDDNEPEILYADNGPAESYSTFTGGNVVLGIDELRMDSAALILGITAGTGQTPSITFDDDQNAPYVGLGFIAKKVIEGVLKYRLILLYRVKFRIPSASLSTQGETVTFQTPSLTADIFKDDSAKHKWQTWQDYDTEDAALSALQTALA